MKILHKYVLKEHLGPLTFALSALTSIMLLNYIAKRFGDLVGKGLPWTAIAEFFALSIPFTVALTLPMAVLVSTLYAFSRLASENEITALKASGVGLPRVLAPVMIAGLGVTVLMIIFNDQVLPRTNHRLAQLQSDIAQTKPTFALREQVINEMPGGRLYLRTNHLDEASNDMREVTIYDMSDAAVRRTIYADSGNLAMASNRKDLLMTLYSGYIQDVPVAQPTRLQRVFYRTNIIRVNNVANQFQKSEGGSAKSDREMSVCEMQAEVDKNEEEYALSRQSFQTNLSLAKAMKVKLAPIVLETPTPEHDGPSLGTGYCKLLKLIGVVGVDSAVAAPVPDAQNPQANQPSRPPTPQLDAQIRAQQARAQAQARARAAAMGQLRFTPPPQMPTITPMVVDGARSRMLDARKEMAKYEVEIHKKFALAVACFIFVMLGAPIALRFPRGGVGLTIGVSLLVFALYYVGLIAGESLANHGIVPAAISMWAANIVFGLVALILLSQMGKESGTARGGGLRDSLDSMRDGIKRRLRSRGIIRERRSAA